MALYLSTFLSFAMRLNDIFQKSIDLKMIFILPTTEAQNLQQV